MQKYKNMKIQKYENTKIQKYTQIQKHTNEYNKYNNRKMQKHKNTKIQKYIQSFSDTKPIRQTFTIATESAPACCLGSQDSGCLASYPAAPACHTACPPACRRLSCQPYCLACIVFYIIGLLDYILLLYSHYYKTNPKTL